MTEFEPKPTSAKPRVVEGVEFVCWHVGIGQYRWRANFGQLVVGQHFGHGTYFAIVEGVILPTRFRSLEGAMRGAVKAMRVRAKVRGDSIMGARVAPVGDRDEPQAEGAEVH